MFQLATENVKVQQSAKKPSVFAFGEYELDSKENWIVGVMAKYNLFSGIDNNKNIRAAELKKYAAELMTERTKQEVENVLYKFFSELNSSQNQPSASPKTPRLLRKTCASSNCPLRKAWVQPPRLC